uniref:Uncharacterized protein n=1 Tax=Triticum urartu TaxID=4572 RepID=A0A8R7UIC4_TRIUA
MGCIHVGYAEGDSCSGLIVCSSCWRSTAAYDPPGSCLTDLLGIIQLPTMSSLRNGIAQLIDGRAGSPR